MVKTIWLNRLRCSLNQLTIRLWFVIILVEIWSPVAHTHILYQTWCRLQNWTDLASFFVDQYPNIYIYIHIRIYTYIYIVHVFDWHYTFQILETHPYHQHVVLDAKNAWEVLIVKPGDGHCETHRTKLGIFQPWSWVP